MSASAMPPLTMDGARCSSPTKLNECMMPTTVPSSPSNGASVMNVPSTHCRLSACSISADARSCMAPSNELWACSRPSRTVRK